LETIYLFHNNLIVLNPIRCSNISALGYKCQCKSIILTDVDQNVTIILSIYQLNIVFFLH